MALPTSNVIRPEGTQAGTLEPSVSELLAYFERQRRAEEAMLITITNAAKEAVKPHKDPAEPCKHNWQQPRPNARFQVCRSCGVRRF